MPTAPHVPGSTPSRRAASLIDDPFTHRKASIRSGRPVGTGKGFQPKNSRIAEYGFDGWLRALFFPAEKCLDTDPESLGRLWLCEL